MLTNKYARGVNAGIRQLAIPIGAVGIVLLLVLPIPAPLLDLLIIVNMIGALVIMTRIFFLKKPLDFSTFPSILLLMTLFRVGLSVASTRLILTEAHAGSIIEAFGQVTVGGNMVVGFVVFLILVVIQFIVITKGAERVAQVGARFTLDAMQGKQSAIDVDYSQGRLTDEEASRRRAEVTAESDFYGSMDGASSFVKGDAIVGIIIIIINLIAGVAVGAMFHGMPIMEALQTYALLTIGDGLVTQIPALLMAAATGLIVTRASGEEDLGSVAGSQLTSSPQALMIPGAVALLMGVVPGMPILLFWAIGGGLIFAGIRIHKRQAQAAAAPAVAPATNETTANDTEKMLDSMRTLPLEVRLADDLARVEHSEGGLSGRVGAMRKTIGNKYGFIIPTVRILNDPTLEPGHYTLNVHEVPMAEGVAPVGRLFARGENLDAISGIDGVDPAFMEVGKWIPAELRLSAELSGARVSEVSALISSHLSKVVMDNASKLLSRESVSEMNERLKAWSPSTVDELVPASLTLAELHNVLRGMLEEKVPLNNLEAIYDALTIAAKKSTHTEFLIEEARTAVAPQIAASVAPEGNIAYIQPDELLERTLIQGSTKKDGVTEMSVEAITLDTMVASVLETYQSAYTDGHDLVLLCAKGLRPYLSRLLRQQRIPVPVLSYEEASSANFSMTSFGKAAYAPGNS